MNHLAFNASSYYVLLGFIGGEYLCFGEIVHETYACRPTRV